MTSGSRPFHFQTGDAASPTNEGSLGLDRHKISVLGFLGGLDSNWRIEKSSRILGFGVCGLYFREA